MSDPFYSSKYSIARAKEHIGNFERQIAAFMTSNPYARIVETDLNRREEIHKVKLTKPMPVALQGIAADAITNLRNALDQAMYAVVPKKNAFFPIAPDMASFENTVKGRLKNHPQEIVDLIRGFKPYKGGNNALWCLNELANTNKHAIICPVAVSTGTVNLHRLDIEGGFALSPPYWDRVKNEMEIFRHQLGGTANVDFTITTFIAMCDVDIVDGKPAIAILNDLLRIVNDIVLAIEAEARRIGLIT